MSHEKGGSDEKNRQWPYCGNKVGVRRDEPCAMSDVQWSE